MTVPSYRTLWNVNGSIGVLNTELMGLEDWLAANFVDEDYDLDFDTIQSPNPDYDPNISTYSSVPNYPNITEKRVYVDVEGIRAATLLKLTWGGNIYPRVSHDDRASTKWGD